MEKPGSTTRRHSKGRILVYKGIYNIELVQFVRVGEVVHTMCVSYEKHQCGAMLRVSTE